ncbi:RNA ligase partner protein, partial [Myxococcota bacterium]|nr:RNA ligase partner protein [Myxococcota bacterium]
DLILLASELNAAVVSSDRGVVTWAEKMGTRIVHPEKLRPLMEGLCPSVKDQLPVKNSK